MRLSPRRLPRAERSRPLWFFLRDHGPHMSLKMRDANVIGSLLFVSDVLCACGWVGGCVGVCGCGCVYVCVYVYVYVYVCACACVCVCVRMCCVCVRMCVYGCEHARALVCARVVICLCVYVRTYVYVNLH